MADESAAGAATSAEGSMATIPSMAKSLRAQLGDAFDAEVIAAAVKAEFGSYSNTRVVHYVPIFVERRVRTRLGASS
jgi:hypothetical protein